MLSVKCFEMFSSPFHARALKIEKYRSYHDKHEFKLYSLEWPTADEAATKAKMPKGIFVNRRKSIARKQKLEEDLTSSCGGQTEIC